MSVDMPRENPGQLPASNSHTNPPTAANLDNSMIRSLFEAVLSEKNRTRAGGAFEVNVWLKDASARTFSITTRSNTVTYVHDGRRWKKNDEIELPSTDPEAKFALTNEGVKVENDSDSICERLQRLWKQANQ